MKTLDRYVTRSFLLSMLMLMLAMLTLRVVTDLFVNMDEFTEKDQGFLQNLREIGSYYEYQLLVYFAQLGGVTVVASAAFAIGWMNRSNELTAMMASGVSLRRVMLPIIACSLIMSGVIFAVRELVIPSSAVAQKLVRHRDDVPGTNQFPIFFLSDGQKADWFCGLFIPAERTMKDATVIIRDEKYGALGRISG
ncbi:MAG: LptF/LptG family permease, partial [Planctomycetes bacterium]|nr:LptF/LptG family permease [Planctomycetota bacterium]